MEETVTTTQIAARIGVSERTALRWIAEGKLAATLIRHGRYLVNSDDITALAPIPFGSQVESRLTELERQIRVLEARVGELEKRPIAPVAPAPARIVKPAPAPYTAAAVTASDNVTSDKKDIPSARSFAELHGVTRWRMEGQIKAQAFATTSVVVDNSGRIVHSLNQQQQATVIAHWISIGLAYTPCADCPHTKTV